MTDLTQCAPAKLNLALHVRSRRSDGYHELDTVFAFLADGDQLTLSSGDGCSLDVIGPFSKELSSTGDNLVMLAAKALAQSAGLTPNCHFVLDKQLPVASGIGGGSADAAAALRLCNIFWNLNWPLDRLAELGLTLGADIPACLYSQSCHGSGIGEKLQPISNAEWVGSPVLLINPLKQISTRQIFNIWDNQDRGGLAGDSSRIDSLTNGRNDLEPMAKTLCPDIGTILHHLGTSGPVLARMSGSGATCYAIYRSKSERDQALYAANKAFPKAWTMTSCLHDWNYSNGC